MLIPPCNAAALTNGPAIQLGHVWQGFDGEQVKEWLAGAGFTACTYRTLPPDPAAKGPNLFVATALCEAGPA